MLCPLYCPPWQKEWNHQMRQMESTWTYKIFPSEFPISWGMTCEYRGISQDPCRIRKAVSKLYYYYSRPHGSPIVQYYMSIISYPIISYPTHISWKMFNIPWPFYVCPAAPLPRCFKRSNQIIMLARATSEDDKAGGVVSNKRLLRRLQEWRENEKWAMSTFCLWE